MKITFEDHSAEVLERLTLLLEEHSKNAGLVAEDMLKSYALLIQATYATALHIW